MANWRKLWSNLTDSEDFNEMPDDFTRLTWSMLMLALDSEGRSIDKPAAIRSRIFPLRDDVTNEMVSGALDWFAQRGMIVRYEVNGRRYFYQVNFEKYQGTRTSRREQASTIPSLNEQCVNVVDTSHAEVMQDSCTTHAEVMRDSRLDKERVREIRESDVADGDSDFAAVFSLFEKLDPRAHVTEIQADDLKDLFAEHGRDRMEYAIKQASDHGAPTLAYIKGVLKGNGVRAPSRGGIKQVNQPVGVRGW